MTETSKTLTNRAGTGVPCTDCGGPLPEYKFGRPARLCVDCRESRARERTPAYSRKFRQEKQAILNKAKDRPCADCGQSYPSWVMDLDHVRGEKATNCAALAVNGSKQALIDEIAKCEVVCANCHRRRTHQRSVVQ